MSGLNPFRPRRSEHPPAHPHPVSLNLDPSFISPAPTTSVPDTSFHPNGVPPSPSAARASQKEDSVASDDPSPTDPFRQESYIDDENARDDEGLEPSHQFIPELPPGPVWDGRLQEPNNVASSVDSSPTFATTSSRPTVGNPDHDIITETDDSGHFYDDSNPSVRSLTPYGGTRTADSSAVDLSETSSIRQGTGKTARSTSGNLSSTITGDSKSIASRSGNRERIPPPPPKSHHGKLITPNLDNVPSQGSSSKATNRFSFQGSASESSFSPKPSISTTDYFTGEAGSQPEKAAESLRRSQSQHKRPPTPPLSRRHSQMRRSKTTLSKPTINRLSMPVGTMEGTESPPPSPSSWQLTPSRTRETRLGTPSSERNSSRPNLQTPGPSAAISTPGTDVSSSPSVSQGRASSTKRASQINTLPPPPPPRRTRKSSNQSSDSSRPISRRFDENEPFVPQPSNAHDILADLSRLQKEVDDLRGHFENHKPSE